MSVVIDALHWLNRAAVEVVGQAGWLLLIAIPGYMTSRFYKILERSSDSHIQLIKEFGSSSEAKLVDRRRMLDKSDRRYTTAFWFLAQAAVLWVYFNGHAILRAMERLSD